MSTHAAPQSNISNAVDAVSIEIVRRGGLIIYPTETIYGLGCIATDARAIERVFEVKGRAPDKPPPVLVADEDQLWALVADVPNAARALMRAHWPGALTLVLPARDDVCPLLLGRDDTGAPTIAVRRSAHVMARLLCELAGAPLVATSANRAGATGNAAIPRSLDDIEAELKAAVDCVFDGGIVDGQPSTIVDCAGLHPCLLRAGAVAWP